MSTSSPARPPLDERDSAALRAYLLSFHWDLRDEVAERMVVDGGMRLWQRILDFVPPAPPGATALELGSPPFHITLLLQALREYTLSLAAFPVDGRTELVRELRSAARDEAHTFRCRCFDAEHDRFPFDDASFDLVLWCEVIEHLTANPVHALSEIHRVLKPGGALVVSTPNVARTELVAALLRGDNVYDPYHLGAPLAGSRHSREYTHGELTALLAGCGFEVERAEDHDICELQTRSARWLAPVHRLLGGFTGGHHRGHLFVRVRKRGPFHWRFPEGLFDPAHLALYRAPRDAVVTMGDNDVPHTGSGWSAVAPGPGGEASRHCTVGDLTVVAGPDGAQAVTLRIAGGDGEVQVFRDVAQTPVMLAWEAVRAPGDGWHEVRVPLTESVAAGVPLQVRLTAPAPLAVARVAAVA